MNIENGQDVPASKKTGGLSAKTVILPAVALMLVLHVLIMVNMFRINGFGAQVSASMQNNFSYLQVSKDFENGSESLGDKANLYVSTGNASHLDGYFYVMDEMQGQGQSMLQMLQSSQSNGAYEQIFVTMRDFEKRVQTECHAIRLAAESYGLDLSKYPRLEALELTAEELALSPDEQQSAAAALLTSGEYLRINGETHEHIGRAIRTVSEDTAQKVAQQSETLGKARTLQWVMALVIIVVLNVMIVMLFVMLLTPLERSVEKVQQGEPLPAEKGVSEFRRLAVSYNELLHHKKMAESYLRKQSETDALTNLPNRMAFQEYIARLSWDKPDSAVTVFSLDVNGLKETNDNSGHAYGDELLRKCAACILSVFGDEPGRKCFRFGGDEFAAFWVNVPRDEIDPVLARFADEQAAQGVSISVGYAYTEALGQTTVEALFEEADKYMYKDKARYHKKFPAAVR